MTRSQHACFTTLFCVVAICSAACGGQSESIAAQCERIRDRLIRLELPLNDHKREAHARVMRRAMGDQFLAYCERSMTKETRSCILEASDAKATVACGAPHNEQAGQAAARRALIAEVDAGGGPYVCWRNLAAPNIVLEGAACNLGANNRGAPNPGMSCVERGSCGAPYGR